MKYYIITGASSGIGASLAKHLLKNGNSVTCVSRRKNEELIAMAEQAGVSLTWIEQDLSDPIFLEREDLGIFPERRAKKTEGVYLINNAGTLEPIGPLGKVNNKKMLNTIRLNISAPTVLSSHFIKHYGDLDADKAILNITSGLAARPLHGLSGYSMSKAALNMLTRTMAVEQEANPYPIKVVAISPGMVETSMQTKLRNSPAEDLPGRIRYLRAREEGKVRDPDAMASVLISMVHDKSIESGRIMHVRDYLGDEE